MSEEKHSNAEAQNDGQGQQWEQDWPPFRASDHKEDTGDAPDESDAYRAKMEAMAQREDKDPLLDNLENGTPLEGESERAQTSYHVDYHPKQKGEDNATYSRRSAWERLVREKSEEFPRLRGKEAGHPDESDETNEEWYARVGIPSFEDFMKGDDETAPEGEDTHEKSIREQWAEMTDEEKRKFVREHPRNPGEKTEDWARRIGLLEEGSEEGGDSDDDDSGEDTGDDAGDETDGEEYDVEDDGEATDEESGEDEDSDHETEESAEFDREVALGVLGGEAAQDWLDGRYTPAQLEAMSDEELEKVYQEYLDSLKDKTEDEEDKEKAERERLLGIIGGEDFQDWLDGRYTPADILKMSNEELQRLIDEYNRRGTGEDEGEEESGPREVEDPLVAVALNREKDARDAAHDIAEHMLEKNKVDRGLIYRVVFGTMFREATIKHYEKQAYEMILDKQRGTSGELTEQDWSTKAGLETFVQAHVRGLEEEMIHGDAGEKMDTYGLSKDDNGETVVTHYWVDADGNRHEDRVDNDSAEGKATITMHDAIAEYARTGDKNAFRDAISTLNQELAQAGGNPDALMADNYMAVAEAARDRAEHGKAIEDVMDGFRFINGEARSNIRTEAHRDALDKITDRLSNSALGRFLPPEAIGAAASAAVFFGKTPVRAALVAGGTVLVGATAGAAIVPVLVGAGMAGVTAALKERNRVTGDRATQARDLARGQEVEDAVVPTSGSRRKIRAAEKAKRYGEQMAEVQYDTVEAKSITQTLNDAIESGDADRITKAFAQADTLVKMSDRRGIDLISYSNADADVIAEERMQLDIARATAKTKLRELGVDDVRAHVSDAVEKATETLENEIDAKDKAFRGLRRRRAAAQGLKSAVIAAAFSVGTQEVAAFADQGQVGLVETGVNKAAKSMVGHELTQNASDARNTFLAGLVGLKRVSNYDAILHQGAELTDAERAQFENDPNYTVVRGADKVTTTTEEMPTSEALDGLPDATRSNWLGNGTSGSDGNELRGYYSSDRGVYTHLTGKSWGGGQTIETANLTSDDVGFVVKMGGVTKFIPATGSDGNFAPDLSGQPQWVADAINGRHFQNISCVYNNGVDTSGTILGSSFWTFSGDGKLPDIVTTTVETTTPTWDVIQHVTEEASREVAAPIFIPGAASRVDLPPMKPREAQKPENVGGAPRTHMEDPEHDDGGDNDGEVIDTVTVGPGGDYVTPTGESISEIRNGDDGEHSDEPTAEPVSEVENGETESNDDDTAEESAPAESEVEATTEETTEETGGEGDSIEYTPVRYDAEDTTIHLSDDELRKRAAAAGKTLNDYDLNVLKHDIERWNAADPIYRSRALDGRRKVDHRKMTDYGPMMTNTISPMLVEYGLAVAEDDIEPTEESAGEEVGEDNGENLDMAA